jgi:hypothetical protein
MTGKRGTHGGGGPKPKPKKKASESTESAASSESGSKSEGTEEKKSFGDKTKDFLLSNAGNAGGQFIGGFASAAGSDIYNRLLGQDPSSMGGGGGGGGSEDGGDTAADTAEAASDINDSVVNTAVTAVAGKANGKDYSKAADESKDTDKALKKELSDVKHLDKETEGITDRSKDILKDYGIGSSGLSTKSIKIESTSKKIDKMFGPKKVADKNDVASLYSKSNGTDVTSQVNRIVQLLEANNELLANGNKAVQLPTELKRSDLETSIVSNAGKIKALRERDVYEHSANALVEKGGGGGNGSAQQNTTTSGGSSIGQKLKNAADSAKSHFSLGKALKYGALGYAAHETGLDQAAWDRAKGLPDSAKAMAKKAKEQATEIAKAGKEKGGEYADNLGKKFNKATGKKSAANSLDPSTNLFKSGAPGKFTGKIRAAESSDIDTNDINSTPDGPKAFLNRINSSNTLTGDNYNKFFSQVDNNGIPKIKDGIKINSIDIGKHWWNKNVIHTSVGDITGGLTNDLIDEAKQAANEANINYKNKGQVTKYNDIDKKADKQQRSIMTKSDNKSGSILSTNTLPTDAPTFITDYWNNRNQYYNLYKNKSTNTLTKTQYYSKSIEDKLDKEYKSFITEYNVKNNDGHEFTENEMQTLFLKHFSDYGGREALDKYRFTYGQKLDANSYTASVRRFALSKRYKPSDELQSLVDNVTGVSPADRLNSKFNMTPVFKTYNNDYGTSQYVTNTNIVRQDDKTGETRGH